MNSNKRTLHGIFGHVARFAAATLLAGATHAAFAHVDYVDLSDSNLSPGGLNGATFSNFGWWTGTTSTLGDSHALAGGSFFKFHLSQDSLVSITFSDVSFAPGSLNPAFSLYKGLLPDEAHDDTLVDPLNPHASTFPFAKIASPVDNGVLSPFRDTANISYNGQFNALGSWSMANESGDWSVIQYVTHVGPSNGMVVSLLNYSLTAGDYTIAAGGGSVFATETAVTGLDGTVSFSAAPVPEPEAAWMFAGGLLLLGAIRKRRTAQQPV